MSFLQQQATIQGIFGAKRKIGAITVDCIIDENTTDELIITKQPVQQGAQIADHSYLQPTVLSMRILQQVQNPITELVGSFSGGILGGTAALRDLYNKFLKLQSERQPFNVMTPKRAYSSMLLAVVRLNTDKNTENILSLSLTFEQVILVSTQTTIVPKELLRNAAVNQANQNAGKKNLDSALFDAKQGFNTLRGN